MPSTALLAESARHPYYEKERRFERKFGSQEASRFWCLEEAQIVSRTCYNCTVKLLFQLQEVSPFHGSSYDDAEESDVSGASSPAAEESDEEEPVFDSSNWTLSRTADFQETLTKVCTHDAREIHDSFLSLHSRFFRAPFM